MKFKFTQTLTLSTLIALSLLLTMTGCKKSNSSSGNAGFGATISGTAYQPSIVLAFDQSAYMTVGSYYLKSGDTISMALTFPDNTAVNTAIDFTNSELGYGDTKGTINFDSGETPSHGTIKITSFDKTNLKIAGTFSGVIYDTGGGNDSVIVTNGTFNTAYLAF